MNLQKLFETQRELDAKILLQKGLVGYDLLDKKILSLQVELGELANELPEEFKFWANKKNDYEKALKEYVDGLHFILSIGLEEGFNKPGYEYLHELNIGVYTDTDIVRQFRDTFQAIGALITNGDLESYEILFLYFIGLGKYLGFTWEQIEQAYFEKNEINHERQENGY